MKNEAPYPSSSPQEVVWLDQILTPDLPCYNVGVAVQFDGQVDVERFEAAPRRVVAERDALLLVQAESGAQQCFLPQFDLSLPRHDFSMHPDAQERAWAHLQRAFSLPFSLYHQPLWRMQWVQVSSSSACWLLCFHHLVADGWSISLICNAVADTYNRLARGACLESNADASPTYCRFLAQDQQYLASPRSQRDREFWLSRFDCLPEPIFARTLIGQRAHRAERLMWPLPRTVCARLTQVAASLGCSSTHFLLAALAILLARLLRDREEVVIWRRSSPPGSA